MAANPKYWGPKAMDPKSRWLPVRYSRESLPDSGDSQPESGARVVNFRNYGPASTNDESRFCIAAALEREIPADSGFSNRPEISHWLSGGLIPAPLWQPQGQQRQNHDQIQQRLKLPHLFDHDVMHRPQYGDYVNQLVQLWPYRPQAAHGPVVRSQRQGQHQNER